LGRNYIWQENAHENRVGFKKKSPSTLITWQAYLSKCWWIFRHWDGRYL